MKDRTFAKRYYENFKKQEITILENMIMNCIW